MNVCRFRIERKNAQGKQLPAVPVEMRSMSFSGTLSNGDWVELSQKWTPGALLHPHEVVNLTTKVPFKSTLGVANTFKAYPRLMKVMAVIAGLIFLAVVAGFVVFAISAHNSFTQLTSSIANGGHPPAENAAFQLSSSSGAPGSSIRVSGSGWEPHEIVVFRYGPEDMGNATADGSGSFVNQLIRVPADATGFFKTIEATGQSSVKTISQPFTVIIASAASPSCRSYAGPNGERISVTPTVATRGQTVQVVGSGFPANAVVGVEVEWPTGFGGGIQVTADNGGAWVGRLAIPPTAPLGCDAVAARFHTTALVVVVAGLTVTA